MGSRYPPFEEWLLTHVSPLDKVKTVLDTVHDLSQGRSVEVHGQVFEPLVGVQLTPDMVNQKLCDDARDWAPRGKKDELATRLVDTSNGWSLHHPLRKMLKYKIEVMDPRREEVASAQQVAIKARSLRPLDDANVRSHKKRKVWTVKKHVAHNAEQISSVAPFLKACLTHATQNDYEWMYVDEMPFGNRQRCDLYLESDTRRVVVESKTSNLLHGIGQVLHYHELAKREILGYAEAPHLKIVVLACAANPSELETAHKFGVHVWWPDGPSLPF